MSLEVFVSKVFNITEDELKALIYEGEGESLKLKDDAGEVLINKYATDIAAKVKKNETAKFDQGYQKANKEIADRYKAAFKEKLKFDSEKEDINEILDELNESIKVKSKNPLTEDQVKTNPVFLAREKELNEAIKKMETDYANEKDNIIKEYQRKENLIKVKEKAEAVLLSSGAVLSEDPLRRKNQINVFLNQFEGYDYDLTGDVPLILKDGQRLEDKLNNPVKFEDFIKSQAESIFDIRKQDPSGNAGNDPAGGGAGGSYVFKDHADYSQQYQNAPDRATKMEIHTAWESSQKK